MIFSPVIKSVGPRHRLRAQGGAALIVGLMLLLMLTLLGIAAVRGTTSGERMTANQQQHMQTFQATEAAIRSVMTELRGEAAPPAGTTESILITALNNGVDPVPATLAKTARDVSTSQGVKARSQTAYAGTKNLSGYRMGVENGAYVAYQFTIDASGKQAGSNAAAAQQQGIARVGPRP